MSAATPEHDFREITWRLYQAVSSAPGQRNWNAVRQHYHPEARLVRTGVNFFTVIHDGGRWLIMSIVWDNERAGLSLPNTLTNGMHSRAIG